MVVIIMVLAAVLVVAVVVQFVHERIVGAPVGGVLEKRGDSAMAAGGLVMSDGGLSGLSKGLFSDDDD